MRLSTMMLLLSIASAPMVLFGVWSFQQSLRDPPTTFTQAAGEIVEVHTSTGRLSKSEVRFKLKDDPNFFDYPLFFPRYYFLSERLATGKRVELTHRPEARDEIWTLKLDGEVILHGCHHSLLHQRLALFSITRHLSSGYRARCIRPANGI